MLQAKECLRGYRIDRLALIVASSIGVDPGMAFSTRDAMPVEHVFDGGRFAQIDARTRAAMLAHVVETGGSPELPFCRYST